MRFEVKIDSKIWARFEKRLRDRGLRFESASDFLEAALSTAISDSGFPSPPSKPGEKPVSNVSSTTVMVTPGRIKVSQLPEE